MSGMLSEVRLKKIADAIGNVLSEAHRGAVPLGLGRSVIAFGNDGQHADPVGKAAVENARRALAADGFAVGTVAVCGFGYSWCFEAVPPDGMSWSEAVAAVETAVWEGWAAARDLDPDRDGFARLQRGIAWGVTCGTTVVEVLY